MKSGKGFSKREVTVIIFMIAFSLGFSYAFDYTPVQPEGPLACFDDTCFTIEVVDTPETRQVGLMYREYLAPDSGMLFIFEEEAIYPFWMKNTLIELDMIWMNADYEVVYIARNVPPCEVEQCPSYNPGVAALYVLEVAGGRAAESGITVGDTMYVRYS